MNNTIGHHFDPEDEIVVKWVTRQAGLGGTPHYATVDLGVDTTLFMDPDKVGELRDALNGLLETEPS